MAKEFAEKFYNSTRWRKCRAAYVAGRRALDGGVCEKCRREIGEIVHHIEWLTPENIHDMDIALSHENLVFVCLDCHNKISPEESGRELYTFDSDGQPVPVKKERRYPPCLH